MLFDPTLMTSVRPGPLDPGSALRRWLKRLGLIAFVVAGAWAALLLFGPLI
jgi:hypothetical protein